MEIITTSSTSTAGEARAPTASPRPPAWSGGAPLPARLRQVLEQLSGYDLRDVRVYPGSPWPARLGARAFVFGSDIHLSPGAEDALEHEAWHVVQQKQGRVRPTSCLQAHRLGAVGLNDEEALEREADMMGLLARGLVPRGEVLPMTGALCIAPLHRPVVQRQVTVSGVEITDAARLQEEIKLRLYLMGHDVVGFATIIADMLRENLVFKTWREVRRELRVREVGYQVETTMRQLAGDHAQRFRTASTQLSAALNRAPRASLRERDAIADTVYKEAGVIRWGNASFLQYKNKDLHMFKWLEGTRQQEPLRMNCWEAVLYALVRTGLVDKSYITWCNKRHPTGTTEMANLDTASNLTVSILENMDYYFWAPGLAPKMARRDKQKLPEQRGKSQGIQIPSDMVIPRGRILMFAFNAHVALSTGNIVNNKHEILELDGGTSTIQLGTIEDLPAHYQESMVVAPFPICPAGTVTVTQEDRDKTAKKQQLSTKNRREVKPKKENAEALSQKRIREIESMRDVPGNLQFDIEKDIQSLIAKEQAACRLECERYDQQARDKTDKELKTWLQTRPDPGLGVITLQYQASDPYEGELELP